MGKSLISSYKATIALLIIYVFGLAVATFIEKYMGTAAAKVIVYYSPAFLFLQFLLILNFILISLEYNLLKKKKWGFMLIHFAFIIILVGAFTSHILGKEGIIHLREGEKTNRMFVRTNHGDSYHNLPFQLELIQFKVSRYPGSHNPSSFESRLLLHTDNQSVEQNVSMNHVLDFKGYRLFQASYDKDEKGSILSVNRDVAGRNITYAGYAILIIGFILCYTGKNTHFRQLISKLKN